MKIPSYGDRFTTFGRRRSLFPASRVFSRSGLFLRRLKISSAVHDEIILEEILFNLLISSVICIFRVEVDDIFRKRWCEWCNNCYLYPINKAGSFWSLSSLHFPGPISRPDFSIVEIDLCKLSLFRQFRLSMSVAGRREPLPGFNDVPKLRLFFTCIRPFWPPFFSVVRADCAVGEQGVRDCGFDREQETSSLPFFRFRTGCLRDRWKLRRTTELYDDYDI